MTFQVPVTAEYDGFDRDAVSDTEIELKVSRVKKTD
jgi:hypothetical protein